jgi:hypothetical protein
MTYHSPMTPEEEAEKVHLALRYWRSIYDEPEPEAGTPAHEAWFHGLFTFIRVTCLEASISMRVPGATFAECSEVARRLRAGNSVTLVLDDDELTLQPDLLEAWLEAGIEGLGED